MSLLNRSLCVIVGCVFLLISLISPVLGTDWTPVENNETNETTTQEDPDSVNITGLRDKIDTTNWQGIFVGALGFAYLGAEFSYYAFLWVTTQFGMSQAHGITIATAGAIILFSAIVFGLAMAAAKVGKVWFKYFFIIMITIMLLSLFFGFFVGV